MQDKQGTETVASPTPLPSVRNATFAEGLPAQNKDGYERQAHTTSGTYAFIDSRELAARWNVPESWVRDQVRSRAEDPLPHVNLGKYVRFIGAVRSLRNGLPGV
jgi:hypothetical protein